MSDAWWRRAGLTVWALLLSAAVVAAGPLGARQVRAAAIVAPPTAAPADNASVDEATDEGSDEDADDDEPRASVKQAVFVEGALWIMDDKGGLFRLDRSARHAIAETVPPHAEAICAFGNRLLVGYGRRDGPRQATLHLSFRGPGGWAPYGDVNIEGGQFIALNCAGPTPLVVTSNSLIEVRPDGPRVRALGGELDGSLVQVSLRTGDSLYIGFDRGEWGGGMKRIDLDTFAVETPQKHRPKSICGEPLEPACDPVNGLVEDPWKPDCVLAAVGLVHFTPHGRLVRVCGSGAVETFYNEVIPSETDAKTGDIFLGGTTPFFGLWRAGGKVIAAGADELYEFTGPGKPRTIPSPKYVDIDGFHISYDVPGFAIVLSDINKHAAVSGAHPLLVPLEPN